MADEFSELTSETQVLKASWRLINQMNGALFTTSPNRSIVRLGAIHARDNGGQWGPGNVHVSVSAMVGRLRARLHARGDA